MSAMVTIDCPGIMSWCWWCAHIRSIYGRVSLRTPRVCAVSRYRSALSASGLRSACDS